jgi:predicted kinase
MSQVYIMRGLPGSGKSTWIKNKFSHVSPEGILVVSADDYHVVNGVYKYDPCKAGDAHNWCLRQFVDAITGRSDAYEAIICDNTNTSLAEIMPYIRVATAFGHNVTVVNVICPLETAFTRNIHGVPYGVYQVMQRNLMTDLIPPHIAIRQEVVFTS